MARRPRRLNLPSIQTPKEDAQETDISFEMPKGDNLTASFIDTEVSVRNAFQVPRQLTAEARISFSDLADITQIAQVHDSVILGIDLATSEEVAENAIIVIDSAVPNIQRIGRAMRHDPDAPEPEIRELANDLRTRLNHAMLRHVSTALERAVTHNLLFGGTVTGRMSTQGQGLSQTMRRTALSVDELAAAMRKIVRQIELPDIFYEEPNAQLKYLMPMSREQLVEFAKNYKIDIPEISKTVGPINALRFKIRKAMQSIAANTPKSTRAFHYGFELDEDRQRHIPYYGLYGYDARADEIQQRIEQLEKALKAEDGDPTATLRMLAKKLGSTDINPDTLAVSVEREPGDLLLLSVSMRVQVEDATDTEDNASVLKMLEDYSADELSARKLLHMITSTIERNDMKPDYKQERLERFAAAARELLDTEGPLEGNAAFEARVRAVGKAKPGRANRKLNIRK